MIMIVSRVPLELEILKLDTKALLDKPVTLIQLTGGSLAWNITYLPTLQVLRKRLLRAYLSSLVKRRKREYQCVVEKSAKTYFLIVHSLQQMPHVSQSLHLLLRGFWRVCESWMRINGPTTSTWSSYWKHQIFSSSNFWSLEGCIYAFGRLSSSLAIRPCYELYIHVNSMVKKIFTTLLTKTKIPFVLISTRIIVTVEWKRTVLDLFSVHPRTHYRWC